MCKLEVRSEDGVDTLIFLDVDGVLNVAAKDPGHNPPTFNASNLAHAHHLRRAGPTVDLIAEKMLILHDTHRDTDGITYGQLMSRSDLDVSDVLVGRFAQIVAAAGPRGKVVLCSSWRQPKHVQRVRDLEALVSKHMGCTFAFHDRTATEGKDNCAAGRLVFIGDYVEKYCSANRQSQVRVVVLEDFLITQVTGWVCGKTKVNSVSDAERYLESRGLAHASGDEHPCVAQKVSAKVIHTYQQWTAPEGAYHSKPMQMIVGVGLGVDHVSRALDFLGKPIAKEPDTDVVDMVKEPLLFPEKAATRAPKVARVYESGKVGYVPPTGLATVNIMECLETDCSADEFWSMHISEYAQHEQRISAAMADVRESHLRNRLPVGLSIENLEVDRSRQTACA